MRRRLGVTQGRVSAIEHAKSGATELRTLAAYVEALGGRLEIVATSATHASPSPNPAQQPHNPQAVWTTIVLRIAGSRSLIRI